MGFLSDILRDQFQGLDPRNIWRDRSKPFDVISHFSGTYGTLQGLRRYYDKYFKPPEVPKQPNEVTTIGGINKVPVVYGQRQLKGNIAFFGVNGDVLHVVYVFASGEIESYENIWIDDVSISDAKWGGYASPPSVTITTVGTACSFVYSATIADGHITAVTTLGIVGFAGVYSQAPSVVITGDGVGAVAHTVLDPSGGIASVVVTEQGSGYTSASISFVGSETSVASATANVSLGCLTGFNLISGGGGYTAVPFVVLSGSGLANALISAGQVTGFVVTNAGPVNTVFEYKYGAPGQATPLGLIAAFPAEWSSSMVGTNLAYVYAQYTWDKSKFNGPIPDVKAEIKGRKLYDPISETTAYSANPALIIYDYLTNAVYGKGIPSSELNLEYLAVAKDICDVPIQKHDGTPDTIPQFECNIVLDTNETWFDNLTRLLATCRGSLPRSGGQYYLRVEKAYDVDLDGPRFDFNLDVITGPLTITGASKKTKLNRVKVGFTNPDKEWKSEQVVVASALYLSEDRGFVLEQDVSLEAELSPYRAHATADFLLKKSREGLTVSFEALLSAYSVLPGDIVTVTHPTPGWVTKQFRAASIELLLTGNVGVSLVEHEDYVYDYEIQPEVAGPPDTNLPDPFYMSPPSNLQLASGTDQLMIANDGTVLSRIKVSWTAPTSIFLDGYEIYWKASTDAQPTTAIISEEFTEYYIGGVKDYDATSGVTYEIGLRAKNSAGVWSVYVVETGYHVEGKSEAPPAVTNFLVERQPDGTRTLSWAYAASPLDLSHFEIRYVLGVATSWEMMLKLPGGEGVPGKLRLFETNQLAAGNYTFGIVAVDTSGNQSTHAEYIVELGDPRLGNVLANLDIQNLSWVGTKTGCWINEVNELEAADTSTWADFSAQGNAWSGWTVWNRAPYSPFTYVYESPTHTGLIDLNVVTKVTPLVSVAGTGSFLTQISTSNDNINWGSWISSGTTVTCRYIRVKVTATTITLPAKISSLTCIISADVITEDVTDKNTATLVSPYRLGTGDFRVPITKTFSVIRSVSVALQGLSSGNWTWSLIDKDVTIGPRIKIWNNNVLADCVVDVHLEGS